MKKNCWDFKKCGRGPGSRNAREKGECITSSMSIYDGVNGGHNGGRVCWIIAGTACHDEPQLTFLHKLEACRTCDFYRVIKAEEGSKLNIPLEVVESLVDSTK